MKDVLALGLYDYYVVGEILQTTAARFNDIKLGTLGCLQIDWLPRFIKYVCA